jgi:hypothetical protein
MHHVTILVKHVKVQNTPRDKSLNVAIVGTYIDHGTLDAVVKHFD